MTIAVIVLRIFVVLALVYNVGAMQECYKKHDLLGVIYHGFWAVIIAIALV